jgi:hypothetical protein
MDHERPSLSARCANVADVIASVNFGRESCIEIAIRDGGHSGPGLAMVDGGLVIDLSETTGIQVDPESQTVRVEGSATRAGVDHATDDFRAGDGQRDRLDNGRRRTDARSGSRLSESQVRSDHPRLAECRRRIGRGSLVHASEDEYPDLFWGLRGGGNFGVVTSFEFELHPVDTVIGGPMFWPLGDHVETIQWYRRWLPETPDDVCTSAPVGPVPPFEPFPEKIQGQRISGSVWSYTGPHEEFEDVIQGGPRRRRTS